MENLHKLVELKDFIHPESRLHERDLVDSEPGRDFARMGPLRHAIEPKSTQKERESITFAKTLSDYLQSAHKENSFHELFVIAAPSFLGTLRQTFTPALTNLIKKEVNKDVVHLSTSEILSQLE
jgi:protein required for attachment to host cells